ncbi:sigma-70 family RNA polymerase sigma factor [Chitinophaga sedimenti]|uniref:sigma-70 family RNA polymerase sigma factor n=1 Tax=Chitinophaga sedimenti TaxID=2033606 RepID=UPI002003B0A7|nr:sigma-70 family RNA polymerase sigma factor [Chitinophaga sedimenti]MCK7553997.1 sigma-70 family RNA polymerase sigma factor [Chitinophaga sedimenti]
MANLIDYSDQELLLLIRQHNRAAFEELYRRYAESLYNFAFNVLKNEDECADAIQEIFVWCWTNRERLEMSEPGPYLRMAVKYRLTRYIQNSRRRAEILAQRVPDGEFTDDSTEVKQLREAISAVIANLPEKAARIFNLSRNEYLTNREIALKLGISEKTVENQMTIVLRKLRMALGKMHFWSTLL